VQQFKIVQESLLQTRILVITESALGESFVAGIVQKVKARLGDKVNVIVERVTNIPPERSGKYRYVVSQVNNDQRELTHA
ncbi:MAG: hypothetical protein K2X64_06440, partial [Rhodocyclaceae bacterium]|nr:hypothetical protein [Rhodocyclaceae bacterium]